MMGFKKVAMCLGCHAQDEKLSMSGHCSVCTWAISQRFQLEAQALENEIKSDALKALDDAMEMIKIRAEVAQKACLQEQQVLVKRNVKLSQDLILAYRKLKTLESVKVHEPEERTS